jgi:F0F1-type ATP synthase assembly protein I
MRAVSIQALVAVLVAAVFLIQGPRAALGAAVAGLAMVAGNVLVANTALGGGIQPAGAALSRLILGVAGKWLVVLVVFGVGLAAWRLPALPMLAGLAAGVLANLVAMNLRKTVNPSHKQTGGRIQS